MIPVLTDFLDNPAPGFYFRSRVHCFGKALSMSDISKFFKRTFGLPEVNLSMISEAQQVTGILTDQSAKTLVAALDDVSFEALRIQVAQREAKQTGRAK